MFGLEVPEEILKQINLNKVVERLEKETMLEYTKKFHGKLEGEDLKRLLKEIEDEWGNLKTSVYYYLVAHNSTVFRRYHFITQPPHPQHLPPVPAKRTCE